MARSTPEQAIRRRAWSQAARPGSCDARAWRAAPARRRRPESAGQPAAAGRRAESHRPVSTRRRTAQRVLPGDGGPSRPIRGRCQAAARRPSLQAAHARPRIAGPGHRRGARPADTTGRPTDTGWRRRHAAGERDPDTAGWRPTDTAGERSADTSGREDARHRASAGRYPDTPPQRRPGRGQRRVAARGQLLVPRSGPRRTVRGLRPAAGGEPCPAAGRASAAASARRLTGAARPGVTSCAVRPRAVRLGAVSRAGRRTDAGRAAGADGIRGQLPGRPTAPVRSATRRPSS